MEPLSVSLDGDTLRIALCGEIDFTNSGLIAQGMRESITHRRPALARVDMAAVTFLDSSGIGALVAGMRAAKDCGAAFRVEGARANVFDQLDMAGLVELFGLRRFDDGVVRRPR